MRIRLSIFAVATAATVVLAGCGGGGTGPASAGGSGSLAGQTIEVAAVWSDEEQADFERVLDEFEQRTGATVNYISAGDELPTVLSTRLAGGSPPDVALVAQPALLRTLAADGSLVPLNEATQAVINEQYAPVWRELGTVDGQLYGFVFKAAHKSMVWYDTDTLGADFTPPAAWDAFIDTLRTRSDIGGAPLSIGGADGWTLTDWFENVYLQTAGPEMYDRLANHEIPWTDPSVRNALEILGQAFQPQFIPGGPANALQTEFTDSVANVFNDDPTADFVFEGDFVSGVIVDSTSSTVGDDARFFPFPPVGGGGDGASVVSGGDTAVALTNDPGTAELMEFLASSEAASIWAAEGGFVSPNKNVDLGVYPDDTTRAVAEGLVNAQTVRFDMSDLMPSSLGGTRGTGFWRAMQDFLADPSRVEEILTALEAEATAAYQGR